MHENPEWEKARQALASISKAGAAGSSAKASSNGPVASAQVREVPAGLGTLSGAGAQWCPLGSPGQGALRMLPEPLSGDARSVSWRSLGPA